MNALQLRMARVALGLTVRQAAELSGASHDTITRLEAGQALKESTIAKVRSALEAAGVIFVEENGHGPGARLRHSVHTEEGSQRLLFRRYSAPLPPGRWDGGRPLFNLPKLAKYNAEGWFVLDEPSDEDRERAARWYPSDRK